MINKGLCFLGIIPCLLLYRHRRYTTLFLEIFPSSSNEYYFSGDNYSLRFDESSRSFFSYLF